MMNEILIMQLEKERDSLISHISRSSRMDVMRLYNVKSYDVVIDMLSKYIRRMPNEIK